MSARIADWLREHAWHLDGMTIRAHMQTIESERRIMAAAPKPEPAEVRRPKLIARLEAARRGFDPTYAYSDDFGFYSRQSEKAATIAECERELGSLAQ